MRVGTNRVWIGLLLISLLLPACSPQRTDPPSEQITVQLKWTHQAQFGGFYAAAQNGYYTDKGLKVSFVEGGPEVDLIASVLEGRAQFGIAGADSLLLARAEGKPVRAIAVIYQRNPLVFISLAELGITRPTDFAGKTIRLTPDMVPTFRAMLARSGVPRDAYAEANLPSDVELFASAEALVWGAYLNGFALTAQQAGYEINIIYPDDYGVHFYADTLFTTDDLIASDPELVTRFLRATLRGWRYAIENPGAVGPLVVEYDPEADAAMEEGRMTASVPLIHTGRDPIGWMRADTWQQMHDILLEQNVLDVPVDVNKAYTMEFLQTVYEDETSPP